MTEFPTKKMMTCDTFEEGDVAPELKANTSTKDHLGTIAPTWLIASGGLILAGLLFMIVFDSFSPAWVPATIAAVLTACGLIFAAVQGEKFPPDKFIIDETTARNLLKISVASMLVPLYFLFAFILFLQRFSAGSEELKSLFLGGLTVIAIIAIVVIGSARAHLQLPRRKSKAIYSWAVVCLSTIAAAAGINAATGVFFDYFIDVYCVLVFLFIAMVLILGYLSQSPEDFISKILTNQPNSTVLTNQPNSTVKTLFCIVGLGVGWFLLWLTTYYLADISIVGMIAAIFFITIWQSYSAEMTGRWLFDENGQQSV